MLSPIQDDVKLIQDECKAILGLDTSASLLLRFGKYLRPLRKPSDSWTTFKGVLADLIKREVKEL